MILLADIICGRMVILPNIMPGVIVLADIFFGRMVVLPEYRAWHGSARWCLLWQDYLTSSPRFAALPLQIFFDGAISVLSVILCVYHRCVLVMSTMQM